jgi:hypothetical protein
MECISTDTNVCAVRGLVWFVRVEQRTGSCDNQQSDSPPIVQQHHLPCAPASNDAANTNGPGEIDALLHSASLVVLRPSMYGV